MTESFTNEEQQAIYNLRNGRDGNLKLQNGQLAVDTGGGTYYTTIVGNFNAEAVRGDEELVLRYADSPHDSSTGDLYLNNGNLYLTNATGTVTLLD